MLNIEWFFWLIILSLAILYWRHALRVKEWAYIAARKRCEELQVQMLDDSVYLRRLWVKRNAQGKLVFWRAFYFEFTVSGGERYFGRVLMLGNLIEEVQLEPHRLY